MNGTATSHHAADTLRVWVLYEDDTTFGRSLEFTEALEAELDEGVTLEPDFHLVSACESFIERMRLQALMGTIDLIVVALHAGEGLPQELASLREAVWFPREHAPLGVIGLVGSAACDHGHFVPQHHRLREVAKQWGVAYLPEGLADSPLADAGPKGIPDVHDTLSSLPSAGPAQRDWGIND
jgi:hypothetical protein